MAKSFAITVVHIVLPREMDIAPLETNIIILLYYHHFNLQIKFPITMNFVFQFFPNYVNLATIFLT